MQIASGIVKMWTVKLGGLGFFGVVMSLSVTTTWVEMPRTVGEMTRNFTIITTNMRTSVPPQGHNVRGGLCTFVMYTVQ